MLTNPTDIARETLKLLASRRIVPTPDNYLKLYNEIAGVEAMPDAGLEQVLRKSLQEAFREEPSLAREFAGFERSLVERDWKGIEQGMGGLLRNRRNGKDTPWALLIRELLKEWDTRRSGLTASRKKEALDRVLSNFSTDAFALHEKLQGLVHRWMEMPVSVGIEAAEGTMGDSASIEPASKVEAAGVAGNDLTVALRELVAQVLEDGLAGRLTQIPDLHQQVMKLASRAREAGDAAALEKLSKDLKKFWFQLELRGEDDAKVLDGLFRLLRLLIDNISDLVVDGDQWLYGQIAVVQEIIAHPLDSRMLYDAERGLKEVIFKQGNLKNSLNEAKNTLKNMIATFVNRLGEMSDSTGGYHDKIEDYSFKLRKAEDINQMNSILGDILRDTKNMQSDIQRTRDDLNQARREVEEAETRVRELEVELQQVSEKVREDQLTGALNRHGMEEVFHRELAHAERTGAPFCLALLDLDNFKRLNDTYGHQAGDAALVHLTRVIKDIIRPTDDVARYGGEEFIIILPETTLDDGIQVVTRLQRELTKRFFLANNERLLITFSAGVSLRGVDETPESMIGRADAALYKAKQAGKNRVFPAE